MGGLGPLSSVNNAVRVSFTGLKKKGSKEPVPAPRAFKVEGAKS